MRRVAFDRGKFDYGKVAPPPADVDLQFSGSGSPRGSAAFRGRDLPGSDLLPRWRAARIWGPRPCPDPAPGETRGEEIPFSRAFWIERPNPASGMLVIHALLDSESLSGAVRMGSAPGDVTFIDVEMTLFARQALDHVGFGCTMGTFLSGPQSRRSFDDVRPAVHGLRVQMPPVAANGFTARSAIRLTCRSRPSWTAIRGVSGSYSVSATRQPSRMTTSASSCPSVWMEPLGDWGAGSVQLIRYSQQIRRQRQHHMYWRPRQPIAAGSELPSAYRQAWCWQPPERPPLALASRMRQGRGTQGRRRRFFVEFTGDRLADAAIVASTRANITATPGAIHGLRLWPYPERKLMRVGFEVDPGNENLSELRLVLEAGGQPVSETWLNRWTWCDRDAAAGGRNRHPSGPARPRGCDAAGKSAGDAGPVVPQLEGLGASRAGRTAGLDDAVAEAPLRLRRRSRTHRLWRLGNVPCRVGQPHDLPAVCLAAAVYGQLLVDCTGLHQRADGFLRPAVQDRPDRTGGNPAASHRRGDADLQ